VSERRARRVESINQRLKQLIGELFRYPADKLTDQTGPGDIPGCDSLGHVTLMAAIQERFGSHVPVEDAIEVESISDLERLLTRLQEAHP
jgi:acyl carrier protein